MPLGISGRSAFSTHAPQEPRTDRPSLNRAIGPRHRADHRDTADAAAVAIWERDFQAGPVLTAPSPLKSLSAHFSTSAFASPLSRANFVLVSSLAEDSPCCKKASAMDRFPRAASGPEYALDCSSSPDK